MNNHRDSDPDRIEMSPELPLPAGLEDSTVARLHDAGLLARPRAWRVRLTPPVALVASVALIALGLAIGRMSATPTAQPILTGTANDLYAVMLYETPGYDHAGGAQERARYSEYSRWIAEARRRGQFVGGEDLDTDRGVVLTPDGGVNASPDASGAGGAALSGFFFVQAPDQDSAVDLARAVPHLRHGGTVVVQKTIPTNTPPVATPRAAPPGSVPQGSARSATTLSPPLPKGGSTMNSETATAETEPEQESPLQVHFWSLDVGAMSAFYTGLGFEEAYREERDGALSFCILKLGDAQIMIGLLADPEPADRPDAEVWRRVAERRGQPGMLSVYARTTAIDKVYTQAQANGAPTLETLWETPWGQRQFTTQDPDGNLLTVFQPRPGP